MPPPLQTTCHVGQTHAPRTQTPKRRRIRKPRMRWPMRATPMVRRMQSALSGSLTRTAKTVLGKTSRGEAESCPSTTCRWGAHRIKQHHSVALQQEPPPICRPLSLGLPRARPPKPSGSRTFAPVRLSHHWARTQQRRRLLQVAGAFLTYMPLLHGEQPRLRFLMPKPNQSPSQPGCPFCHRHLKHRATNPRDRQRRKAEKLRQ
mmetsp:Transcript_54691/g.127931  ORF Transcript_54691/g.127931 Transcript_54691/m.127931 type:complete len:204 (+) Transcript_54691:1440-2051(+)